MDWNKLGAIGSVGSFLIGGMIFAVQVWPVPQLRARKEASPGGSALGSLGPRAMGAFLLVGFLLSGFSIYGAWYPTQAMIVTPENVQSNVRNWIDGFNYYDTRNLGPRELSPLYYWDIEAKRFDGSRTEHISVNKTHDSYIGISCVLPLGPVAEQFGHLSDTDKNEVVRTVNIEMSRLNTTFEWRGDLRNWTGTSAIYLETRIPIHGLTEETFLSAFERLDSSAIVVTETVGLELERRGVMQPSRPAAQ